MRVIALDFETYYSNEYTLKKLNTEEYVRDPRFKPHMVALKLPGMAGLACRPNVLHDPPTRKLIQTSTVLCHHAHFDGLILSAHYDLRPLFWLDTLAMARLVLPRVPSYALGKLAVYFGLADKSVPYELFRGVRDLPVDLFDQVARGCIQDTELNWQLLKILAPYVPREELRVIDTTIRMFTEPRLRLDIPRVQNFVAAEKVMKADAIAKSGVTVEQLSSSGKFKQALEALGYDCPTKPSPTGNGYIPALAKTDDAMKDLLDHEDSRVQALAAARLGVKSTINETRGERLLAMAGRGALPVYLSYCGAHTTRWSGGDKMNWQNFQRGGEIRKSILAPPGCKLVIVDASQIEARVLAWLAGEQWVLDAFAAKRDLYCETASQFYGHEVTSENKAERGLGKLLELSCGYGSGAETIGRTAKRGTYGPPVILSPAEAERAKQVYRGTHPNTVRLWKHGDNWLAILAAGGRLVYKCLEIDDGLIYLPNGTTLDYGGLTWQMQEWVLATRRGTIRLWGSKLVENVVQALARVILGQAMIILTHKIGRPVLTVHDELIFVTQAAAAFQALDLALTELRRAPAWARGLPLDAEGAISENYSK